MAGIASSMNFFRHQAHDDAPKRTIYFSFYKCRQNGALEQSQRGIASVPMEIQFKGDFRN